MARGKRRDGNEAPIVAALVAIGATVTRLDGEGLPDLLVGYRGKTTLLEVKMPLGPKGGLPEHREHEGGRGDLTKAQVAWWDGWRGEVAHVVRSPDEAVAIVGAVALTTGSEQVSQ